MTGKSPRSSDAKLKSVKFALEWQSAFILVMFMF